MAVWTPALKHLLLNFQGLDVVLLSNIVQRSQGSSEETQAWLYRWFSSVVPLIKGLGEPFLEETCLTPSAGFVDRLSLTRTCLLHPSRNTPQFLRDLPRYVYVCLTWLM